MKNRDSISNLLVFLLIVLIVMTVVSVLFARPFLSQNILSFSKDRIVKPTTVEAVRTKIIKILIVLLALNVLLILAFRANLDALKSRVVGMLNHIRWNDVFNLFKKRPVLYLLIFLLFVYFVLMCLMLIYNVDVGTDEGMYISAVKNFYRSGKFNLPWRDFSPVALQLTYYPYFLIKPLFGFSIYSLRLVNLVYSCLLLFFLFFIFRKKYSMLSYAILLTLLVTDKSFVFVSSSGFGEIAACLCLIIGIYFWTRSKNTRNVLPTALFFALAGLTKLQILPFIYIVTFLFIILQEKGRRENLLLIVYVSVIWLVGEFFYAFLQGYDLAAIGRSFWRLASETSAMAETLPVFYRLAHVNAFFVGFNMILLSIVVVYYSKNFRKVVLFEKTSFLFLVLISLWWVFFFVAMNVRNLIYVTVILYMLLSILFDRSRIVIGVAARRLIYGIIALFLVVHFSNATIYSIRLANKGFSDEFNFAFLGYETFAVSDLESGQNDFFEYINEKIPAESDIHYISEDYYKYVFTEREFIMVSPDTIISTLPKNSYFILAYIDYKNDYVTDGLLSYLHNDAELVFKKNYYEVYRIVE